MSRIHIVSAALYFFVLLVSAPAHTASIRREILVDQDPAVVWDAVRDFDACTRAWCPAS